MRTSALKTETVTLLNPLPGKVTPKDIIDAAGFFNPKARGDVEVFTVEYKWAGAGVDEWGNYEYDELTLKPGDTIEMTDQVAKAILSTLKDIGIVMVRKGEDFAAKVLEGLHTALDFYRLNGEEAILRFQQNNQFTDEQMRLQRSVLRAYLINVEKAKVIQAEIDRLSNRKISQFGKKGTE